MTYGINNREPLLNLKKNLDVVKIVDNYFTLARQFTRRYQVSLGIIEENGFREITRCRQALMILKTVMYLKLVLQQVKARDPDPYAYLPEHFTEEEIQRIYCFPAYSREQVDYIISLRDPIGVTEDTVKEKLYRIFDC